MSDWVVDLRVRIDQTPRFREIELSHAEARELADLISAHEARGWQPIDTAPRDRWILVWADCGVTMTHWGGVYNEGNPVDGWVDYDHLNYSDVEYVLDPAPTHWMPLPEPPK